MNDDPRTWYGDPRVATDARSSKRFELRERVDNLLDELIKQFYESVPYASHQRQSDEINLEYYKRHNIETILRLRRKRTIDAHAIHYFTKRDPATGALWAHYVEDEMLHDAWFATDLRKVGVTNEEIYSTEPFLATKLLTGYLQYGMEFEGTPLALITSVYFVEYTTTKTQPEWIKNLEKQLGEDKLRGARKHVGTDLDDEHADFVWGVLESLVLEPEDEERVLAHIRNIANLWVSYFIELYKSVVEKSSSDFDSAKALTSQLA